MMVADLNDYALFAEVVTHGGFAAAGRALRVPKSTLSRRIAALETRLGVRLSLVEDKFKARFHFGCC